MARTSRRKPAQFTKYIKLWLTDDDLKWLDTEAEARGWKAPAVVRKCLAIVQKRRLL
jgi:hypothetical protein